MLSDTLNFIEKQVKRPVCLMGHSMSGMLFASFATVLGQHVDSVVLLDVPIKKPAKKSTSSTLLPLLDEVRQTIRSEKIADLEQAKKRAKEILSKMTQNEKMLNQITSSLVIGSDKQVDWK